MIRGVIQELASLNGNYACNINVDKVFFVNVFFLGAHPFVFVFFIFNYVPYTEISHKVILEI